jgi:hypothetical protein
MDAQAHLVSTPLSFCTLPIFCTLLGVYTLLGFCTIFSSYTPLVRSAKTEIFKVLLLDVVRESKEGVIP